MVRVLVILVVFTYVRVCFVMFEGGRPHLCNRRGVTFFLC